MILSRFQRLRLREAFCSPALAILKIVRSHTVRKIVGDIKKHLAPSPLIQKVLCVLWTSDNSFFRAVPDKGSNNLTARPVFLALLPEKVGSPPPRSLYGEESCSESGLRGFSLTSKAPSLIKCKWEAGLEQAASDLGLGRSPRVYELDRRAPSAQGGISDFIW